MPRRGKGSIRRPARLGGKHTCVLFGHGCHIECERRNSARGVESYVLRGGCQGNGIGGGRQAADRVDAVHTGVGFRTRVQQAVVVVALAVSALYVRTEESAVQCAALYNVYSFQDQGWEHGEIVL